MAYGATRAEPKKMWLGSFPPISPYELATLCPVLASRSPYERARRCPVLTSRMVCYRPKSVLCGVRGPARPELHLHGWRRQLVPSVVMRRCVYGCNAVIYGYSAALYVVRRYVCGEDRLPPFLEPLLLFMEAVLTFSGAHTQTRSREPHAASLLFPAM
eukprot:1956212-Rhodomonas_salina.6